MKLSTMSNISNSKSSLCPTNGRQTVGDGAFTFDKEPSVLAVCQLQGTDDMYYYSTTFSGGPEVGAFDAPKEKCPPDRGSLDCVTGSPASSFTDSPSSSPDSNYRHSFLKDSYRASSPKNIPTHYNVSPTSTPPLTPDDASDYSKSSGSSFDSSSDRDALDFLMTVFPRNGLSALPYSKRVTISSPNLGSDMNGVVMELPGRSRTLYVDGKSADSVNLRESIVALLDLADESLDCTGLVIVLERSSPNLGNVLHSLMYVGGSVVTMPPFQVDPAFILVGLDV